jgi:HEAT repeat protein
VSNWADISWWAGGVLAVAALVVAALALFRDRPRGRRRCPRCWYDMAGVTGMTCPECGREQKAERRFFCTRRRWRGVALAAVMLTLATGTAIAPAAYTGAWARYTPMPVLRFGLSFFDRQARGVAERQGAAWSIGTLTANERLLLAHHFSRQVRALIRNPAPGYSYYAPNPDPGQSLRTVDTFRLAPLLGDEVKPLLPDLLAALRSPDLALRLEAASALGRCGTHALPVLPSIRRLVDPEADSDVALAGGKLLADLKANDAATIRVLRRTAAARSPALRREATFALLLLDPASPETESLVARLGDSDASVEARILATRILGWYAHSREAGLIPGQPRDSLSSRLGIRPSDPPPRPRPSDAAVLALADMLDDPDPQVRTSIAHVLIGAGDTGLAAGPALRAAIDRETDTYLRRVLITAYVSPPRADASPFFDELLESLAGDHQRAIWAAYTLTRCGARAAALTPQVAAVVADPAAGIQLRRVLCAFLGEVGAAGWDVLALMLASDDEIGDWAAHVLGEVATRNEPHALEHVHAALTSPDFRVRARATAGIAAHPSETSRQRLTELVHADPYPEVRLAALSWLSVYQSQHDTFFHTCAAALSDDDPDVATYAANSLRNAARTKPQAAYLLEQLALRGQPHVAETALRLLREIEEARRRESMPYIVDEPAPPASPVKGE